MTAILIPARFASTRFPGKPLAMLRGADGTAKPLIQRSWEAARAAGPCHVLTDDERIADAARSFGADVIMTPAACANGTERCAAALDALPKAEIIVNLQGDSPLIPPGIIAALAAHMEANPEADVATPAFVAGPDVRARLIADAAAGRVGGTSVVTDAKNRAMYFSKRLLPYGVEHDPDLPLRLHLGIYAYRRAALSAYPGLPVGDLEVAEGLEQLRFLQAGFSVDIVEVPPVDDFWEVNNPEDVAIVEAALADRGQV